MSYCSKCGKQLDDDARFCSYCGTSTQKHYRETIRSDEDALYNMKKRAIHYYNIENYDQAYEYCERVLDLVPNDESMNDLKENILLNQSDDVLRRSEYLLENNPYEAIDDEVDRLIDKAERICPENPNIRVVYEKAMNKLYEQIGEMVCGYLDRGDYKSANEWADRLMRDDPNNTWVQAIYKTVKDHSPRKWRR